MWFTCWVTTAYSVSLLTYPRLDTGLKFLSRMSRLAFFRSSLTRASFKDLGKILSLSERLMMSAMILIVDRRICLSKLVGIWSSSQLWLGVNRIIDTLKFGEDDWLEFTELLYLWGSCYLHIWWKVMVFQWDWCESWQSCWWRSCWICQLVLGWYRQEAVVIPWFFSRGDCIHCRCACSLMSSLWWMWRRTHVQLCLGDWTQVNVDMCCESIYIGIVLVPVPLKLSSVSDGFSSVTVKPGDLGVTWEFFTFDRCMVVQYCWSVVL